MEKEAPIIRQSQCLAHYGNPFSKGWEAKWLVYVDPPYPLHMNSVRVEHFRVNREVVPSLLRVFNRVWEAAGHDMKKIDAWHADRFSGAHAPRNARGLGMISMHAYGLALDFDAANNPLGAKKYFFKKGNPLVDAFLTEGWVWGGPWRRSDAMHFQRAIVG